MNLTLQDRAYSKLSQLADEIGSYDRFLSTAEEAKLDGIEGDYEARWIVAALASGRAELHERLAKVDRDLDAIRARRLYSKTAIHRLRQDLRDGLTNYAQATPLQHFILTTGGKSQVPSVAELEEAIDCAVIGATPEEQERSGRCLVD